MKASLELKSQLKDILYDEIYADRVADVQFYVEIARRFPGPVLEVGCGTGRVLIPAVRAGATILGFDLCEERVALCRAKLARESSEIQSRSSVCVADVLTCDLGTNFGVATMPFRSFQSLITVEQEKQALSNIRRHLRVDGYLVLDVFNPSIPLLADSSALREFEEIAISDHRSGSITRLSYRVLSRDYFLQTEDFEETIYRELAGQSQSETRRMTMRYIFRYELEHLLTVTGFTVEEIYGDFDFSPFGLRYPGELIVVAKKTHE